MDDQQPAPGWYPDPHAPGTQRYWDGQAWTEHTAPMGGQQPGPQAGYGQQGMPMQGGVTPQRSGMAVASMVLGIVGVATICCYGFGIIPAVVGLPLGWVTLNRIKQGEAPETDYTMAKAGVILGWIGVGLFVLFVGMVFFLGFFPFLFA